MPFKTVLFGNLDRLSWNRWVSGLPDASYAHSWDYLRFMSLLPGLHSHESFVAFESETAPLAIVPLALSTTGATTELAFPQSTPLPAPALARLKPSARRRLLDEIVGKIEDAGLAGDAKRCTFRGFSTTEACADHDPQALTFLFELLRYPLVLQTTTTLCVDLALNEETLMDNLSKYRRRHILRAARDGQQVRVYNAHHEPRKIREWFDAFHRAHCDSAGRETQSQPCWDAMADAVEAGFGSLFVSYLGDEAISFLYCGEFGRVAYGWSQANRREFEAEHAPRHLLEWEAIRHYKARDFGLYEIGDRYRWAQPFHDPSPKEVSIAEFKERYGGFLLPKTLWMGYFDRRLMEADLSLSYSEMIRALPCGLLSRPVRPS